MKRKALLLVLLTLCVAVCLVVTSCSLSGIDGSTSKTNVSGTTNSDNTDSGITTDSSNGTSEGTTDSSNVTDTSKEPDDVCTEHKGGEATCEKLAECEICGEEYGVFADHTEETVEGMEPTCEESGLTEGKKCTVCGEVLSVQEEIAAIGHNYVDGHCTVCGSKTPSVGLEYTLSYDETYYIVSGIGTCTDIEIVIPSIYMGKPVMSIGYQAFEKCISITNVAIPNSITFIDSWAFCYCTSLTSIEIPSSVTNIGFSAFRTCTNLTNIIVDKRNEAYMSINGNLYTKNGKILVQYAIGKKDTEFVIPNSVTNIDSWALYYCSNLTSVTYEEDSQLTSIGERAFGDCPKLTSIEIPQSVTSISRYAFYMCRNLTSVSFEVNCQLTSIGDKAFYYCGNLTNIVIPSTVTRIGYEAFRSCGNLTNIVIPSTVTSMGNFAFGGCDNLTIYCEAQSQPSEWSSNWNLSNCPVVWGYKVEE